mgnify:CR=1 FL=1
MNRYYTVSLVALLVLVLALPIYALLEPVRLETIEIGGFWKQQAKRMTEHWLPHCIGQMEKGGRGHDRPLPARDPGAREGALMGRRTKARECAFQLLYQWEITGEPMETVLDGFWRMRSGTPQIYIVSTDGLGTPRRITTDSYADRATWAPAPYNEIAYAARTGGGYDIKVFDVASGERRQITFSQGSNESPAYSPNGRHLAFTSTRRGKTQIFTIGRDGRGLRQVTTAGNNYTPHWSR